MDAHTENRTWPLRQALLRFYPTHTHAESISHNFITTTCTELEARGILTVEDYAAAPGVRIFQDPLSEVGFDALVLNPRGLTKCLSEHEKALGAPYLDKMPPEMLQKLSDVAALSTACKNRLKSIEATQVFHLRFLTPHTLLKQPGFGKGMAQMLENLVDVNNPQRVPGYFRSAAEDGSFLDRDPVLKAFSQQQPAPPMPPSQGDMLKKIKGNLRPRQEADFLNAMRAVGLEMVQNSDGSIRLAPQAPSARPNE